jgi:hypothetical protein
LQLKTTIRTICTFSFFVFLICPAEWAQAELLQLCQGRSKGYLKQDSLLKDRANIYDEKGQRKALLAPS